MTALQICTFMVGRQLLGLRLDQVREIARPQALTRVPLSPLAILGLMNLRGEIVPAIDARRCLGLEDGSERREPAHIILEGNHCVSLLADEIGDIVQLESSELGRAPSHLRGAIQRVVEGVLSLDGRLLLLLSRDRLLEVAVEGSR